MKRRGLNPGVLGRLLAEAEAAILTCRECHRTAMPWEIFLEARKSDPRRQDVEHVCPECAG